MPDKMRTLYSICNGQEVHISSKDVDSYMELALKNKVFPVVYQYFIQNGYLFHDQYIFRYQKYVKAREKTIKIIQQIMARKSEETSILLLKGIGLEKYYPRKMDRHITDIDICVKNQSSFWEVGNILQQELKLDLYSTMHFYQDFDGQLYGSGRFEEEVFDPTFQGVEIQLGRFPISPRTYIPWDAMAWKMETMTLDESTIYIPSPESALVILLAEILTRPDKIYLRDYIDAHSILEYNVDNFDIQFVVKQIDTFQLFPSLILFLQFITRYHLQMPPMLEKILNVSKQVKQSGMLTGHIIPYCLKNSNTPIRDLFYHALRQITYSLNDRDQLLTFLKKTDEVIGPKLFFNNRVHVYFMKISSYRGNLQWLLIDHYHVVVTPIGTFVACMHALYSDDELDELRRKFEKSRSC